MHLITSFTQQTPKGHLATTFSSLLLFSQVSELLKQYGCARMHFCSFCKHIILSSLLLFVKLLFHCNLLIFWLCCFSTSFCPVLRPGFMPLHSSPKPIAFAAAAWITTWSSLRATCWSAVTEKVSDFYLHALQHERLVPLGVCSSCLQQTEII